MTSQEAVPASRARLFGAVFLLQASWNYERQQGLGFGAALAATIDRLGLAGEERSRFLRRHTGSFNANPVMAPWVIGAVARMEADRLRTGAPPEDEIDRLKTALSIHLARLGDSIVWSAVRPLCAAVGIAAALLGAPAAVAAAIAWILYNAVQVPMRWAGLALGLSEGAAVAQRLVSPRWNRTLERIRDVGAALAGVVAGLVAARAVEDGEHSRFLIAAVAAAATGFAVEKRRGGATGIAFIVLLAAVALSAAGVL